MNSTDRNASVASTIDHLHQRWEKADKLILLNVFPLLAAGHPVSIDEIATAANIPIDRVEKSLEFGRAGRDSRGRVTSLAGLTATPTNHRVNVDGVILYECCALLSHLLPKLLSNPIEVESVDPITRRLVRAEIGPDGIASVAPASAVATMAVTDMEVVTGNLGESLCSHVHHFTDWTSALEFADADRRRFLLPIEELHDAATMAYETIWAPPSP